MENINFTTEKGTKIEIQVLANTVKGGCNFIAKVAKQTKVAYPTRISESDVGWNIIGVGVAISETASEYIAAEEAKNAALEQNLVHQYNSKGFGHAE